MSKQTADSKFPTLITRNETEIQRWYYEALPFILFKFATVDCNFLTNAYIVTNLQSFYYAPYAPYNTFYDPASDFVIKNNMIAHSGASPPSQVPANLGYKIYFLNPLQDQPGTANPTTNKPVLRIGNTYTQFLQFNYKIFYLDWIYLQASKPPGTTAQASQREAVQVRVSLIYCKKYGEVKWDATWVNRFGFGKISKYTTGNQYKYFNYCFPLDQQEFFFVGINNMIEYEDIMETSQCYAPKIPYTTTNSTVVRFAYAETTAVRNIEHTDKIQIFYQKTFKLNCDMEHSSWGESLLFDMKGLETVYGKSGDIASGYPDFYMYSGGLFFLVEVDGGDQKWSTVFYQDVPNDKSIPTVQDISTPLVGVTFAYTQFYSDQS